MEFLYLEHVASSEGARTTDFMLLLAITSVMNVFPLCGVPVFSSVIWSTVQQVKEKQNIAIHVCIALHLVVAASIELVIYVC